MLSRKIVLPLLLALIPGLALGFQTPQGGRGLFRVQDARSEGYGWLTIEAGGLYRNFTGGHTGLQHTLDLPFGIDYAFFDWLEIMAAPGYAAAGDTLGSVRFADITGTLTDVRLGGKVCPTSWLPVAKLGGAFFYQIPVRSHELMIHGDTVRFRDYPLIAHKYMEARGMLTLDLRDIMSNLPISLTGNYGYTWDGAFAADSPPTGTHWTFTGIGLELSTANMQVFGELTGEDSSGKTLLGSPARQRLTFGGRGRLGLLSAGLSFDKGLTSDLPSWTYGLHLSFSSPVGRPQLGGIAGTIVDQRTGAPLTGIVTLPQARGFKNKAIPVGSDGAFKIEKVPVGTVLLDADVPEYQKYSGYATVVNNQTAIMEIKLRPLRQFGTITGRVTDAKTGDALAAAVRFPGTSITETATDPGNGTYTVKDIPVGSAPIEVSVEGYQIGSASVVVKDNEVTTQNFELRPLKVFGTITGRVLDATSKAPLEATITFPESTGLAAASADSATGVFTANAVPVGTITIDASAAGHIHEARPVVVEESKVTNVDFMLRAAKEFGSVSGTVTDATDGKPVTALVSFADPNLPQALTDTATGFYKADNIPVGVNVIKAAADGYIPAQMTVTVEVNKAISQDFKLNPAAQYGQLTGMVKDKASKAPLEATIYFPNSLTPGVMSDSGAGFYKAPVPIGPVVVACSLPGYATQMATTPVIIKKEEPAIYNFDMLKIGTEITLSADAIHFAFNSAEIQPEGYPALNEWVKLMKENPLMTAEIQGHTDAVGPEEYNQGLSERRASAVVDYLTGKGSERARLTSIGYGESRLIEQTQGKSATNRRVVFKVTGEVKVKR
jgi:outer membrane protein OmpA-like peptidoglycan-associated protein